MKDRNNLDSNTSFYSEKDLELLKKSARPMSQRKKPVSIDQKHDVVYFSAEEDKDNPQPDFIEGWEGSLPTKPFPEKQKNYKLLDEQPNIEYHDHGPRDKCDASCRFFKPKQSVPLSRHPMVTRSQGKNANK